MKISIFLELALPRPWSADSDYKVFQEGLEVVDAAERAGLSTAWITEHHFMEEYSTASAPEIFLAAASQRTSRIRLGHGIMHMPPQINHPARVAERISTLDQISNGRVEFGTGEASSVAELGGFMVDPGKKRAQWIEAVKVATRAMTETPFTGFYGEHIEMPPRNVIPKPRQTPHPPLWVACTTHQTAIMAAENGIGALNFSRLGPEVLVDRVQEYYQIFEERGVPIAPGINANFLAAVGDLALMIGDTMDEAIARSGHGAGFFGFGIKHYYTRYHRPGVDNIWQELEAAIARDPTIAYGPDRGPIGTPADVRDFLRGYEETGVDEVMFLLNAENHEGTLESIERLGTEVMPEFIEREEKHAAEKAKWAERVYELVESRRPKNQAPPLDPDYTFGGVPVSFDGTYIAREGAIAQEEHEVERKKRAAQAAASAGQS